MDIVAFALYALLFANSPTINKRPRQMFEATRISLILWLQLLRRSARGGRGSRCLLDYLTIFNDEAMDAKRGARIWSPDLYTLVKSWNQMQQNISKVNVKADRATPMPLVRLVQVMEWESSVKLGSLMERMFELEEVHWKRRDAELLA